MSQPWDQFSQSCSDAGSCLLAEPVSVQSPASAARSSMSLAVETAGVALATIAAVRLIHVHQPADIAWLLIPCMLVTAALAPAWIARREFPRRRPPRRAASVGPQDRLAGLSLYSAAGLSRSVAADLLGPADSLATGPGGSAELAHLAAVPVPVRSGSRRSIFPRVHPGQRHEIAPRTASWSRAGTAVDRHDDLRGVLRPGPRRRARSDISILTFLPGLLMAWLFVRTRSLLAPILFHGLANVSYGIMAATFA